MTYPLADLLKDSSYKLTQFSAEKIKALESAITVKDSGKKPAPYVTCLVRGKPIKLTPEEAIRQLYVMVLRDDLGYPVKRAVEIAIEEDEAAGLAYLAAQNVLSPGAQPSASTAGYLQ